MAFDVFVSYPHKDKATADAACAALEGAGIRCWIAPRDVAPGFQWAESIVEAIDSCRVMVLIFSAQTNISGQVHREVERAVSKGIPIIPLRIEDVSPNRSLQYFLGSIHWLDALTPPLERHLDRLVEAVRSCIDLSADRGARDRETEQPRQAIASGDVTDARSSVAGTSPGREARHREPRRIWTGLAVASLLIGVCALSVAFYLRGGHGVPAAQVAEPPRDTASAGEGAKGPSGAAEDAQRFDGIWIGTLTCAPTPRLPGWKYQIVFTVTDGTLHGQKGEQGKPGSEVFTGRIKSDGTTEIAQRGLSGDTERDPFHRAPGTEYGNTYLGKFDASHGVVTRLNRASCNIDFVTQAEARSPPAQSDPPPTR